MKILTKDEYVDFEAPIQMTESQNKKFIEFMKREFSDIKIVYDVHEVERPPIKKGAAKPWTVDDYYILLTTTDLDEIERKTGRGGTSVGVKYSDFVPRFEIWAKKKGYRKPYSQKMIAEFNEASS